MKKSFYLLLLLLCISCNELSNKNKELNKENKIEKSIEIELKKDLNDANSYEFVGMKITDTFSVKERKKMLTDEKFNSIINNDYHDKNFIDFTKKSKLFLDNQKDETKDAVYYIEFKARAKNKFGVVVLNEFSITILNDNEFKTMLIK
jgi:hypothetical protein